MRRRHLDSLGRRILLDDVSSFLLQASVVLLGSSDVLVDPSFPAAPTVSPKAGEVLPVGPNSYRQDHRPQQQIFDLDLDLNPDL
jgi:hypothetical protein